MKRTVITLVALVAGLGLTGTSVAQGRHDDKPHGYNAKVAAAQKQAQERPVTLAVGPRAHDNPLRFTTVKAALGEKAQPAAVTKAERK